MSNAARIVDGLILSPEDVHELAAAKEQADRANERIAKIIQRAAKKMTAPIAEPVDFDAEATKRLKRAGVK